MYQPSLFDDAPRDPGRSLVGIAGSAPALTPAQKKFNSLIERIKLQRRELEEWRVFGQVYHQQLADHYQPALARLRQKQVSMARWLDATLDGKALGKRERAKVRDILLNMLSQLLAQSEDPDAEMVRLYDKHSPRSFHAGQQEGAEALRTLASEAFGVDVDGYAGGDSPEEFAEWLDTQLGEGGARSSQARPRKKSAKTLAREAQQEQEAQGGTRAVREIFRKLASELHPDRETDPTEHARKTELMQRVNRAYKAGDLLALLELQLRIEQIDPQALASLSDERLRHYIHVLEEQSRRLRDELEEFLAPFATAMEHAPRGTLSPAKVQQALEADIRQIQRLARQLDADLAHFQDLPAFKRSLRDYAVESSDREDDRCEARRPRGRRRSRNA